MKKIYIFFLLSFVVSAFAQDPQKNISNQVRSITEYATEISNQIRMGKEYYLTSPDKAAGSDFMERTSNLSKHIKTIFTTFQDKRLKEYEKVIITFSSSDKKTAGHQTKTVDIAKNAYIFYKIIRTEDGDWKGGPTINGVDKTSWREGEIDGGPVSWTTGGHREARTTWTISSKYSPTYIQNLINSDVDFIKRLLTSNQLPTE